jgi:tetrahydromethanopterin S-methyltransferase subunit G
MSTRDIPIVAGPVLGMAVALIAMLIIVFA